MVIYRNIMELREKMQKCEEYIGYLEEEFKKIQAFERELPLCLELISQAIERCKEQMNVRISGSVKGQFDDQTWSECPVLEEFIPMKSTSSTNEDEDDDDHMLLKQEVFHKSDSNDWLASAQLSIQAPNPLFKELINQDILSKKLSSTDENSNGCGTFHVFDQEKKPSISALAEIGGGRGGDRGGGGGDKGPSNKKERRCWSQELHRRFLHAIQHLGGAHVATPKQIREFMKVDGLTNDEIKSHLQKYRLHTRRLSPTMHNTHTPQFVVVGRIWMPPLDYTTSAATSLVTDDIKNAKAVYAPITSLPQSIAYKTKQCKQ